MGVIPSATDEERGDAGDVATLPHDDVATQRLESLRKKYGATWDGPSDPDDPYNWTTSRKVVLAVVYSFGQLVTLMAASMTAAALGQISHDLNISANTAQITFSIYFVGLALGPFLIAPLAEMLGRKPIWICSNMWFILWNSLCPVGNSLGLMVAGRFLAAMGASAGITLTGPVMSDVYTPDQRGKSLAIAAFLPYLGPALGPIVGGLVSDHLAWHWIFWVLSAFTALTTILGFILLRETYTPVLLVRKASLLEPGQQQQEQTVLSSIRKVLALLPGNLKRPLQILVRRPIVQIVSFSMGLQFAIYCLMLSTLATLYRESYGASESSSSLHYNTISIGSTASAFIGSRLMDWIYRRLKNGRGQGVGRPEFRAPYQAPAVLLIPIGLVWYGWAAQKKLPWPMVDAGTILFTWGNFMVSQGYLAYLLDEFAEHGASVQASARLFSNLLAFVFPIFAPSLYERLGYGWGNSTLAFIHCALGLPIPLVLWLWGEKLRAIGREKA